MLEPVVVVVVVVVAVDGVGVGAGVGAAVFVVCVSAGVGVRVDLVVVVFAVVSVAETTLVKLREFSPCESLPPSPPISSIPLHFKLPLLVK